MDGLKQAFRMAALCASVLAMGSAWGQAAPAAASGTKKSAPPLRLQSLAPDTLADPFPPVDPKYFTAESPTVATVDSYLHRVLGYDSNRIWRVIAIQKTAAEGVSKVTALVSEKVANAKVQQAVFFVLPDGKHLIADMQSGVLPFGADPYAAARATLQAKADGPFEGSAAKDLMLVEFADLECPHCKEAQPTMKRLAEDFPKARLVYQSFPLTQIHPFAFKAAAYGVCVAKKSNAAFFAYAQAVYDTQSQLTEAAANDTLKAAATKAGADAAVVEACAATDETKQAVEASIKLAGELGVEQTPMLAINGRLIPLGGVPYETLKEIIIFQAGLDGVSAATPVLLDTGK